MIEPNETTTKSWTLALTAMATFMVMLDTMVVATTLSTIRVDLGASIEALEWTINAFSLTFAALLLTGAALGDRFGRRRMLVVGLGVFVAASVACALAPSVDWLIAGRAAQGAGAALVTPLAMALLSATFPPQERAKALGIFGGLAGLALIAGPVVGGAIAQGVAWRWIFWINLPIGLALIPLARSRLQESRGAGAALDFAGVALVTGAALATVWGLMRGNQAGWSSGEVAAALAAGLVLAAGFVVWERRARAPMVPMGLFRSRAFSAGITASYLFNAAMYGVLFFLPQFLQTAQGYGPLDAGLRLLPWTATLFVVAPVAGGLVNRIGERPLIVVGLFLQAVGMAWIALIATPDLAYQNLAAALFLTGTGVSMAMPAAQNAVLGAVAKADIGKASGIFNMSRFLGGVSGIAIAVAVFTGTGSFGSAQAFSAGFVAAIGVASVLSLLGALAGLWLPGRPALALVPTDVKA